MAESTIVRIKRDAAIVIAGSAGNSYTLAYEPGDFQIDIPLTAVQNFLDRGEMPTTPSIRKGDDQPMTGSFSAYLRDLGDTANGYSTLLEICAQFASNYSVTSMTSTMGANSDERTYTITYVVDGTPFGEADKTLSLSFCSLRGSLAEGDPSSVSVKFTSYKLRPILS